MRARRPVKRATDREAGVVAAVLVAGSEKAAATASACRIRLSSTTWRTPGRKWGRRRRRSWCGSWLRGCASRKVGHERTSSRPPAPLATHSSRDASASCARRARSLALPEGS